MPGRKYQPEPSRFRTCLNNVPVPTKMFEGLEVVKVTYVSLVIFSFFEYYYFWRDTAAGLIFDHWHDGRNSFVILK
jgi:hypothetical protein